jgi:hypothetical protein
VHTDALASPRRWVLDPVADRLAMRRLIDEVVSDYAERALTSTMPPLHDSGTPVPSTTPWPDSVHCSST